METDIITANSELTTTNNIHGNGNRTERSFGEPQVIPLHSHAPTTAPLHHDHEEEEEEEEVIEEATEHPDSETVARLREKFPHIAKRHLIHFLERRPSRSGLIKEGPNGKNVLTDEAEDAITIDKDVREGTLITPKFLAHKKLHGLIRGDRRA
eukprot:GEZU01042389.1.p1 GENE.GEZU01042389.1~~GEZU01042389.1.p1  ORF type:complete len:153 (+),score=33.74 GEZU01042389.1:290-748(+)